MFNVKKVQRRLWNTGSLRWFPVVKKDTEVSSSELAASVATKSGVAAASVDSIITALQKVIISNLQNSKSVEFGELGKFTPSVILKKRDGGSGYWTESSIHNYCSLIANDLDEDDYHYDGIKNDTIGHAAFAFMMSPNGKAKMRNGLQLNIIEEPVYPFIPRF